MQKKHLAALAATALLAASCGKVAGPENHAPVVSATGPATAEPSQTITITASASDADGDVLAFVWTSNEAGDAIAAPSAATTQVTLGGVESTRTFWVRVDDGDTTVTASHAVVVVRDSIPPPPPPTECWIPGAVDKIVADETTTALAFTGLTDGQIVWVHSYGAYGDLHAPYRAPEPAIVAGGRINLNHSPEVPETLPRFSAFIVDNGDTCWADLEGNPDAAWAADGWFFTRDFDHPEPCAMAPLGSNNWTDDGETVTVEADHANWSLYGAFGNDNVPAVTIPGTPLGNGRWRFVVSVEDLESHARSNFHQNYVDWNATPERRAAMGCWADLLRTLLPPDAPFRIRTEDTDGLSLEYVGDGGEPDPPGDCTGKIETEVKVANATTTKVWVPSLADGTLVVLYCYGEPGTQLPWTPLSTTVVGSEAIWQHASQLDSRYTRWNFRDAVAQWGCALEGDPDVVCAADGCAFKRNF